MKINYDKQEIIVKGKTYPFETFKKWFVKNYQPLLPKYHVKGKTLDWHAIFSAVQHNGIIEIFEAENK